MYTYIVCTHVPWLLWYHICCFSSWFQFGCSEKRLIVQFQFLLICWKCTIYTHSRFYCTLPPPTHIYTVHHPYTHKTDADPKERTKLLLKKIEQCCFIFDFTEPMSELRAKEVKRAALTEILDHVTSTSGTLTEPVYPALVQMVGKMAFVKDKNCVDQKTEIAAVYIMWATCTCT